MPKKEIRIKAEIIGEKVLIRHLPIVIKDGVKHIVKSCELINVILKKGERFFIGDIEVAVTAISSNKFGKKAIMFEVCGESEFDFYLLEGTDYILSVEPKMVKDIIRPYTSVLFETEVLNPALKMLPKQYL